MTGLGDKVQQLIEPVLIAMGYELVGIEFRAGGRSSLLRVYIDHAEGIGLDDCEKVSHQVSGILDVEDPLPGQYTLEVSSPGFDRPLFTKEHFQRFAGARAKLRLSSPCQGRRRLDGILVEVRGGNVVIREREDQIEVPLAAIESARLVPET